VPFEEYMLGLKQAQEKGYARLIGVSNYPIADLERTRKLLGEGAIATNQVELHAYLQAPRLRDYARAHGVMLTAYQPLAHGELLGDPVLLEIARRHDAPVSAVALAFLMAEGHAVIPASTSEANLRANFKARDLHLTEGDIAAIRKLDRGLRRINPAKSPRWDD
jgi:2,5-diketo-D-gluconate reductase B